nr:PREDICTED: uncharacterized protein LOC100880518 isoform X2 [Megachile rotundata]
MAVQTPYLNAIQAIPGDTMNQKFGWIARTTKQRLLECNSLEEVAEAQNIPKSLIPLIQVQAALILNKKDSTNQQSYQAIAEALKSRDALVANKAFESRRFFDGTNKTITSVQYFFENLFPYVSLKIRTRIIKTLANRLRSKNTDLAECFFVAVSKTYGLQQALPLLLACSDSFMYNTIVEKRIVLGRKQGKDIFRRNPDFMVKYLKLTKVGDRPNERDLHPVNVFEFTDFLPALIKKRLNSFVELYETYNIRTPMLSNKCAETFLKNGKEHLLRNPQLYICILPLKLISANRMESIFAKLFPRNIDQFNTDAMLNYLNFYPQEKKVDFFLKTYRQVYQKDLLETSKNVTPRLLRMLPLEERAKQARIKLAEVDDDSWNATLISYSKCWKSYLSTEEALPNFKKQVAGTSKMEDRAIILRQMIFCCRVNNDDQALLDVLKYINDRHRNEQQWLFLRVFECLVEQYETPEFNENHMAILTEMILRLRTKNELTGDSVCEKIIEFIIHFKIINKQPLDQMMEVLIESKCASYANDWNILTKYPEYERMCLEACLAILSQKYDSEKAPWHKDKVGAVFDLSNSMYVFNGRHVNKNSSVQRMSVKNYPWLLQKITEVLSEKKMHDVYLMNNFKRMLEEHEKDLLLRFWPEEALKIANVESGEALKLLRKSPESILARWREYVEAAQRSLHSRSVRRFVRTTLWYKDIPVRFVEESFRNMNENTTFDSLGIFAILLHGDTFAQLVEPLIPAVKTIDVHGENAKMDYLQVVSIARASKIVNPPLPLHLVARLLEGEFLNVALIILTNTCRRTPLIEALSFAETMSSQRVSVKKHGIRLMHMIAPRDKLLHFLLSKWESENHHSIREVIFAKARDLFVNDLDENTWKMFSRLVATLTVSEKSAVMELMQLIRQVPDQMVVELVKLILDSIDRFAQAGVSKKETISNTANLLTFINIAECRLLPDDFVEQLLRRFLFHVEPEIAASATEFVIDKYLFPTEDIEKRFNLFARVFVEAVKTGWDVPSRPSFFPVNHGVHHFVSKFTYNVCSSKEKSLKLVEAFRKMFSSVVTSLMNPTSFLNLMYLKEYVALNEPKKFGARIGQMLPELVNAFSLAFIPFMADVLRELALRYRIEGYEQDQLMLGVVEGLVETGTTEAMLMAVNVFKPMKRDNYADRYDNLVRKFSSFKHPAVNGIIADVLNTAC